MTKAADVLVVTTDNIPTYEVTVVIGEVSGSAPATCDLYLVGIKDLNGGSSNTAAVKFARARQSAVAAMAATAREHGANAVTGMRFDTRAVGQKWVEICAYGTAVRIRPVKPAGVGNSSVTHPG
jgi:uncharacterized protein YbjQ (UPF0145 family)